MNMLEIVHHSSTMSPYHLVKSNIVISTVILWAFADAIRQAFIA